mgnify:CR=1 FL=1|tara:strand:- start:1764 stop:5249 length:3486 start_codon:yes stop_codon:yes gene_type:complete
MAGNLLGEPFDKYVNEQIKARQKIHGNATRSLNDLRYLNTRNAWIKLASGCVLNDFRRTKLKGNPLVDNVKSGDGLAKNNVLFNGLSSFEKTGDNGNTPLQRSGITGDTYKKAYGVGGTTQFGYSPMPGITDMSFKCLNRGSIKKATLTIKAHNRNQFDVIDVLYMRLGYSVMLEWGYDKYLDNDLKIRNTEETLIDKWFWNQNKSDYTKVYPKIEEFRKRYNGNYDAAFGIVSNFSWTFESDGTYNIQIEIISLGDVVESLKVNLPSLFSDKDNPNYSGIDGEAYGALLEKSGAEAVPESDFYNILYPNLKEALSNWWDSALSGSGPKAPNITLGVDYKNNWTGRDGIDENDEKISSTKSYGTSWEEKTVTLYNSEGQVYRNPNEAINEGFKVEGEKLIAVRNGILNLFSNGETFGSAASQAYFLESGSSIENINSPFGDNFVKNAIEFAKENSTNSSSFETGQLKQYNSVVLDDTAIVYAFIPFNSDILSSTIQFKVDDPFKADLDDIYTQETNAIGASVVKTEINLLNASSSISSKSTEDQRVEKLIKENIVGGINNPFKTTIRMDWTNKFSSLSDQKKWQTIFDSRITSTGKNFSEVLGITKTKMYTSVYEEFKKKKFADAFPLEPDEEIKLEEFKAAQEEGELTASQEREKTLLDQKLARLQKDYITRSRNRIYEFFYNIREKNNSFDYGKISMINSQGTGGTIGVGKGLASGKVIENTQIINEVIKLDIEPLDNQWFIRLGTFLDFLNTQVIPKVDSSTNPPIVSIDTDTDKTICYALDNVYSLNLKKIAVRNDYFSTGKNPDNTPVLSPVLKGNGVADFLIQSGTGNTSLIYGKIMNIYFNFNRLEQIFDSTTANKNISLFTAIKTICDDINESLGNINNIEPVIKENNIIQLIDQTTIPNIKKIGKTLEIDKFFDDVTKNEVEFEVYGINYQKSPNESNFVRSIGLTTQIDKNFATMITIGATSQGSIPGTEATAFSRWNIGIEDRFKNSIIDAKGKGEILSPMSSSSGQQIQSKYASMLASTDNPWQKFGLTDSAGKDGLKTLNEDNIKYSTNIASDFYSLVQAEASFETKDGKPINEIESSIGFLPFNLKLDMDGIGGIKIYNKLKIAQSFLPSNYDATLEFIITQVNHKLSNNDWITSIETIATSKSVLK